MIATLTPLLDHDNVSARVGGGLGDDAAERGLIDVIRAAGGDERAARA